MGQRTVQIDLASVVGSRAVPGEAGTGRLLGKGDLLCDPERVLRKCEATSPNRTCLSLKNLGPLRTSRLSADHSYALWVAVGWPQLKAVTWDRDFIDGPSRCYRSQLKWLEGRTMKALATALLTLL